MREALLLINTLALAGIALFSPRIGLLAYIWFALMRPDFLAWSTGRFHFSGYIAFAVILGSWRYFENIVPAWIRNPIARTLIVLHMPILASVLLSADRAYSMESYDQFFRMSVMALWIPLVANTLTDVRRLFLVSAIALGVFGLWHGTTGAIMGALHGNVRIYEGIGGFMSENNTFGVGLAMIVPICWYSRQFTDKSWLKILLLAIVIGSINTIILTYSRGAAIALAVDIMLITWYSRHRMIGVVAVAVLFIASLFFLPELYFKRMGTLTDLESESSARSRMIQMVAAGRMWRDYPWFGVGMGDSNYLNLLPRYLDYERNPELIETGARNIVHNSFLQMLVHCGIFAFLIYVYLFGSTIWRMRRSANRLRHNYPDMEGYPRAIQISLISFCVASMVHPRATFDLSYIVVMYGASWYMAERGLPLSQAVISGQRPAVVTPMPSHLRALRP